MPKHTSGHLVRSCCVKKANSGLRRSSKKGEKGAFPKEVSIIVGSIAEPTLDVLVFLPC